MDFNVNVNVKFDATPTLVGAVSSLIGVLKPTEVLKPAIVTDGRAEETVQRDQAASSVTQEQPAPVDEASEISDEMLRKIVGPVSKDKGKGKEAVFAILDEFGVKRVPDLKQDQRQAFIDKLNAL